MTDASKSLGSHIGELRSKWGWFVALGVLMLIAGGIAFANLFLATVVSVYLIGAMMMVAGAFQIVHAFGVKDWGGFAWWLLSGILYTAAGAIAFINPILASSVMTLLLAGALLAAGLIRVWMGFASRDTPNWGWIVAAGVVTALAGVIIAIGWPINSLFVLGIFLAFDLIFQGWGYIAFGLALKR